MLAESLQATIGAFIARRGGGESALTVYAPDCWQVEARFRLPDGAYRLRSLGAGDESALALFGRQLSDHARDMFCPYPWSDAGRCAQAFAAAVAQSVQRVDAAYLLEHEDRPVAHCFLWKAGGNPVSQRAGLEVPELGVAVADAYQGRGFGSLAVRVLQHVAAVVAADAIELTTAVTNDRGWQAYQRTGFEYVGMLRIPLDVDVTAAELGQVAATRFRVERQMAYFTNPAARDAVTRFLATKRGETQNR